jgi:hypothetical protein
MIAPLLILFGLGLAAPAGAAQFTDITLFLGLPGAIGAAWGDYDGDGYPDLFLAGNDAVGYGALLLRNNGGLSFADMSATAGIPTTFVGQIAPVWGDYDNDGALDLFVASDGMVPQLYRNDGGHFTDAASEAGLPAILATGNASRTAAWCDYDGDGWLDLFVCSSSSRLIHNNGDGTLSDATWAAGMAEADGGNCCAWGDYDNDGLPDLVVTRAAPRPALLYHNNGDGTFTEAGGFLSGVVGGVGVAWGDYDNDGRLDLYITSGASPTRDRLFHNDGSGAFTDLAASAGMASDVSSADAVAWADYNNDGRLDIYVGNTQTGGESLLYHNNGNGTFTNVAHTEGMAGTYHDEAAVWADMDLDGRLDLFQAGQLISRLFYNIGPAGNRLRVRALTSGSGDATGGGPVRDAIGARVELNLDNDDSFPTAGQRTLTRLIDGGSGFLSQNEQIAHFGLGSATLLAVRVRFPDGSVVIHRFVPANQQITIRDIPAGREEIFDDVPLDFWAYEQIRGCVDNSIVAGYDDGLYHPDWPVTRDQMAVYISRALAGGDDNVPEFTDTPTFPDVPEDNWALDYIEYAVEQGVVGGYEDGTYHPEYEVTRDQMAVYVARALVAPSGEAALADYVPSDPRNFPDVPDNFWAYRHIEYCVENGVVQGYLDGLYHPEITVTRDQMAVYVARAFGL